MSDLLVVVDVQEDFCEGGALGVDGGRAVAQGIATFLDEHGTDYELVAVSQDHHRPDSDNGGHFSATPDFVDSWPVHCVAGTPGAALRPEITDALERLARREGAPPVARVRKGYGIPSYSAVEGSTGDPAEGRDGEPFGDLVADGAFERADVVGLAFDHCVAATARDLLPLGPRVRILQGLTAAVDAEGTPALAATLRGEGIEIIEGPDGSAVRHDEEE